MSVRIPRSIHGALTAVTIGGNRRTFTGSLITAYITTDCSMCHENGLAENVDFWQDAASFNGTSGIGCGTLANSATCTRRE